jgi:hypothetical protein
MRNGWINRDAENLDRRFMVNGWRHALNLLHVRLDAQGRFTTAPKGFFLFASLGLTGLAAEQRL